MKRFGERVGDFIFENIGWIAAAVFLLTVGFFVMVVFFCAADSRDCIDQCVVEKIQPTRGKCEWVCNHARARDTTTVMPVYMPVGQ